jgi:hypothetical protein
MVSNDIVERIMTHPIYTICESAGGNRAAEKVKTQSQAIRRVSRSNS